jgi:hypothetical protein
VLAVLHQPLQAGVRGAPLRESTPSLHPFNGILVNERTPTAVTSGGRTLAAAILNAHAHGPRNTLS